MFLIILAIIAGGAVVGVADAAAPGDMLYTIDRGVEELRLRLTGDPQSLLQLKEDLHAERLQEVQDLAMRGDPAYMQQALENLEEALEATAMPALGRLELDDDYPDDEEAEDLGAYCNGSKTDPHPAGDKLAQSLTVPYEEVIGWACSGFGFGSIKLAYEISQATGEPVDEIFALKQGGMGWGEIQALYGQKTDEPDGELPEDEDRSVYCNGEPLKEHPTGARLADDYGVTYTEIMGWFCQGYGFGEIDLAYTISQSTETPIDVAIIFGERESGMGWGNIMKEYGLKGKSSLAPGQQDKVKDQDKDKDKDKDKVKSKVKPKIKLPKEPKK
jgi:hypothetical protein